MGGRCTERGDRVREHPATPGTNPHLECGPMLNLQLPERPGGFNPVEPRLRRPAGPGRHRIRVLCAMGSNMRIKFTRSNIEALESPPKGEVFAWCEDKPGWGVRILASGRKSWIVQYRDKSGKSRRHTIGDLRVVPITLAEQRASELLSHAKLGIDLLAEEKAKLTRKATEAKRSVGAMVAAYLVEPEVRRRRSFGETKRYLESVWRQIHGESAETIDRHALTPVLRQIATERGEISANRAKSALSAMFTHAITHGWLRRESNPCQYLPKWEESSRERALNLKELGEIWRAAPEVNEQFGRIIKLLILTGCRRSEIAELRWSEVDFDEAVIRLPGSRTKNARPHLVPLAPAAVEILEAAPRTSDLLVFTGFASWSHAKKALDARVPLSSSWVIHDLRRSVATGLREHVGADTHLVELILNHAGGTRGGVAGVYDRSERMAERRRALERWAELIVGAPAAKVVQLR
jgi:integrase